MMRKSLTVMCVVFLAASAFAATPAPTLINYQGKLVDANSDPLVTGNYVVKFSIYDDPTAGNLIWGPQIFGEGHGDEVPVVNGYFNVVLGPEDHAVPPRPIEKTFSASVRYLEVTVKKGGDPEVVIAPRQRLLSVPYAMKANNGCPTGTIMPYTGPAAGAPPDGWLWCHGEAVTKANYPDLYAIMGTAWGDPNTLGDELDFNLPDLRGRFLRGEDRGTGRDPGAVSRAACNPGGNTGNNVGSIQGESSDSHNHAKGSLKTMFSVGATAANFQRLGPYLLYQPKEGEAPEGVPAGDATGDKASLYQTYSTNYTMTGITATASDALSSTWVDVAGATASSSSTPDTHPVNAYVNYIVKY